MDILALIQSSVPSKENPKNPEGSHFYVATLRSLGQDNKVSEAPITMWFNPKIKDRYGEVLARAPVAVALLGVYVVPGKQVGQVNMTLSDNGRISCAQTSGIEQLTASQG